MRFYFKLVFFLLSAIITDRSVIAQNTFPSTGNVGIGTTSPGAPLQVVGSVNDLISVIGSGAVRGGIYVQSTNSSSQSTIYADNNRGSFASYCGFLTGGTSNALPLLFGLSRSDRSFMIADGTNNLGLGVGTLTAQPLVFGTNNAERVRIDANGNVGVGTSNPQSLLAVKGTVTAQKVVVTLLGWSDYVFHPSYKLLPLHLLEKYVKENQRLPEVPSADSVAKHGIDVGDTQALLLKKIEELTLYIIEQNRRIDDLKSRLQNLEKKQDEK